MDVIDHTISPMGGRMLHRWILFPLKDLHLIKERQQVVEYFFRHTDFRDSIDEQLHNIGDIERISGKIAVGRVSPRDFLQLKTSLQAIKPIKELCLSADNDSMEMFYLKLLLRSRHP